MFRGIAAKLFTGRWVGGGSSLTLPRAVKTSSTNADPVAQKSDEANKEDGFQEETQGSWIKSPLGKQIHFAPDLKTLMPAFHSPKLNSTNAVFLVNAISRLIKEGKMTVHDFQKIEGKEKVEELLAKGRCEVGFVYLLQALQSLLDLGFDPKSLPVASVENELLWQLRKLSLKQHLSIVKFYQNEPRFTEGKERIMSEALANIQRRWVELTDSRDFASFFHLSALFPSKFVEKMEDVLVELVETFTPDDMAKILTEFGASQRRTLPLLRSISYHMNKTSGQLSVRTSIDVLVALQRLSFPDQVLIERVCNDLVAQLTPQVKPSQIGVLLTTLGQLRYRHEGLLEVCEWMNQNWSQVRKKDVISLLLSLAAVDFRPADWTSLWDKISVSLKEEIRSQTLSEHVLLDVVWSMAVLDQLDSETARLVLNNAFVDKLSRSRGSIESPNIGVKLKLNQLWALANLKKWNLEGFNVKMPFVVEKKPKDPSITTETSVTLSHLSRSVLNALVNFIPAGKYLRQNVLTPLGVRMEGECILNHNCVPLPLAQFDQGQPLPDRTARIALLVLEYRDLCVGRPHVTGAQALREKLLELSGYQLVKVNHNEFNPEEKMVTKVQILEQLIKTTALSKL